MAFEELETVTRGNEPPQATVTYDYAQKKGERVRKADAKPRLTISIPTTLCGVSKSKTFRLLVGTGDDLGKLLIRGCDAEKGKANAPFRIGGCDAEKGKAKPGGVAPSQHKHFFRFNFGFVPKLGDEELWGGEKRPVRKVSDEEFEIDVPRSWFAIPEGKD